VALAAVGLAVSPALAADALFLTWNDCYLGATAAANRDFACDTNVGEEDLYCAFTIAQAVNDVIGVEIVVDLQHSAPSLPDWWQFDTGCHQGSLAAAATFPSHTACLDMWAGAASAFAGIQGYIAGEPRGGSGQARIKVVGGVLPQEAVALDATDSYYAARIILRHDKSTGSSSCAGCDQPACLVLNSILVRTLGTDYLIQTGGAGAANWARWQGGAGADCAAVPVRNRAWGQVKSLYR
jgi:hypothetical protein